MARQRDDKFELRRKLAMLQRDLYRHNEQDRDVMLQGAQGVKGFRQMLTEKYGTIACAWRTGLDRDGNGKISWGELSRCCKDIGFTGNLKKLWAELDRDGSGWISMQELDPEAHRNLADFREHIGMLFGSTIEAWNRGLNPTGTHGVAEADFVQRCAAIGFKGDARKLFRWLRTDMRRKELTLHDLDPQAAAALARADPCAQGLSAGQARRAYQSPTPVAPLSPLAAARVSRLSASGSLSAFGSVQGSPTGSPSARLLASSRDVSLFAPADGAEDSLRSPQLSPSTGGQRSAPLLSTFGSSSDGLSSSWSARAGHTTPTRNSAWIRELSLAQIAEIKAQKAVHLESDKGMKSLADLRVRLTSRFGSVLAGWQLALDPYAAGKLSFMEFADRMRDLGYLGDLQELWSALDAGSSGVLRLSDLDAHAAELLAEFRNRLCDKYGNMLRAWLTAFDPQGRGFVERDVFVRQCKEAKVEVDLVELFKLLQDKSDKSDKERKHMSLREFDLRAFNAFKRDDHDMVTEGEGGGLGETATFHDRQDANFSARWRKVQSAMVLVAHKTIKDGEQQQDLNCGDAASLRALLTRKYGSCATGWRIALDPLRQGQLSYEEFVKGVRERVGYRGDFLKLWQELVVRKPNFITLSDIDGEAADALWNFRQLLLSKYGNLVAAWQKGLDPQKAGRLELDVFVKRCEAMGYAGDVKRLFVLLRSGPHKKFITLSDIDLGAAQAYYRGDTAAMTIHGNKAGATSSPRGWAARGELIGLFLEDEQPNGQRELSGSVSHEAPPNSQVSHTRLTQWSQELGRRQRKGVSTRQQDEWEKLKGVKSLPDFRRALASRFRTTLAAWRTAIDPEDLNHLTFGQFCLALDRLGGFSGKVRKLWGELDAAGTGAVSFADFDPEADKAVTELREAMLAKFTGLQEAWAKGLAGDHIERVDEEAFLKRGSECLLDWPQARLRSAFRILLPAPLAGRHHLIEEDLKALLLNLPAVQRREAWSGPAPSTPGSASLELSASSRLLQASSNELPAFGREDFTKMLKANFGSVYAGWVRHLDVTEKGRVPRGEFVQRAKAVGVCGNVNALFQAIDLTNKGYITLQELDPEVAQATDSFFELAEEKCGTLGRCWLLFDPGFKGYVTEVDFLQGCKALGYGGDAARLFQLLKPEKGRSVLFLEDLGPKGVHEARRVRSPMSPKFAKIRDAAKFFQSGSDGRQPAKQASRPPAAAAPVPVASPASRSSARDPASCS